jgi:hypothetical protein
MRLTGLAAGLFVAFALGWAFHGVTEKTAPDATVVQGSGSVLAAAPEQSPSVPALAKQEAASLDPIVKRWEQRGYRAETQKRLVALELKDGRKVNVPIQEVRLHYVGGSVY